MDERVIEPGVASVRAQLGIEQEDPAIFRPYDLEEILPVAGYIRNSSDVPRRVRRIVEVGLVYDLRPQHLAPRLVALGKALGLAPSTVARHRELWEGVDPHLRFDLIQRAVRMLLVFRGSAIR
jgi:hypothetical protein